MKIRLGFVSNSSSASYTVILNESMDDFINTMHDQCSYPYLWPNVIIENLNRSIQGTQERIDLANTHNGRPFFESIEILETRKASLEETRRSVEEIQNNTQGPGGRASNYEEKKRILNLVLTINHITMKDNGSIIQLDATTIIHNNYMEGMPDFLKEIVLYYTFERPKNVMVQIDHRG